MVALMVLKDLGIHGLGSIFGCHVLGGIGFLILSVSIVG